MHTFPFTLEYHQDNELIAMQHCINSFLETNTLNVTSWPISFKPFMVPLKKGDWVKVVSKGRNHGTLGIIQETRYLTQDKNGLWYGHIIIKRPRGDRLYYYARQYLIPYEPTEKDLVAHLSKKIS